MSRSKASSAKKDAILTAALELFAEKGFNATTTKDIAQRSAVAEGLIFYYFGDKRALLQQVIRSFSFFETARTRTHVWEHASGEAALHEYGRMYLSFLDRHRAYLLLIWSPELMRDEAVTREVELLVKEMAAQASQLLKRAIDGAPSEASLEAGASMILSSLFAYSAVQSRFGRPSPEADNAYVREITGIIMRGLRKQ